jgi:hypothetical protein
MTAGGPAPPVVVDAPAASGSNAAGCEARLASSVKLAESAASAGVGAPSPERMTTMTRRLALRPAGVSLGCAGRNSPKPITDNREAAMPRFWNRCTTLAARAADSSQFDG